jgi:hypothetical protein
MSGLLYFFRDFVERVAKGAVLSAERGIDVLRVREIESDPQTAPEHEPFPERKRRTPHSPAPALALLPVEDVDAQNAVADVAALVNG